MKKRVISAIVALFILIPVIIKGGFIFSLVVYILSLLGTKELLGVKESKKELPNFIKFISYIIISLIVLYNSTSTDLVLSVDYRLMAALFITFLVPTVLYHDREKYSVNDAFFLIGSLFFLGVSFSLINVVRNINLNILLYLLLITVFTDTYAYITGLLIGKHKLLELVSPNKTWEGMIGGTVFGTFVATVFYHTVIDPSLSISTLILITLFLSVVGQFGDLVFSAIKRYFKTKDFSNIMPGHGGILDRLDSIIFVVLGFMFFISII